MSVKTNIYPKVSRPGEYVAFFNMQMTTMEGPAYGYLACDAFSEFVFNTGVEQDESPKSVLKHIYLLTEDPDFVQTRNKGFTLVLNRYEELTDEINKIITPVKGKLLFDKKFHNKIASPVLKSFSQMIDNARQ